MLEFEVEAAPEICGDLAARIMGCWPELEVRIEENRLTFLLPTDPDLDLRLSLFEEALQALEKSRGLAEELTPSSRKMTGPEPLPERLRVGRFIIHRPELDIPDEPGLIGLTMEPAMAFGTGAHPTTKLALQALNEYFTPLPGRPATKSARVLDLGSGSGILSLAAMRLGAGSVKAVDCSEEAVRIARRNVELNRLEEHIELERGLAEKTKGRFDLVLANLTPAVLARVARKLPSLLQPGGALIVSGFHDTQAPHVVKILTKAGFIGSKTYSRSGWSALSLTLAPDERLASPDEFTGGEHVALDDVEDDFNP